MTSIKRYEFTQKGYHLITKDYVGDVGQKRVPIMPEAEIEFSDDSTINI